MATKSCISASLTALLALLFIEILISTSLAATDPPDDDAVLALQEMYRTLSYPPQLVGWKSDGGDPCEEELGVLWNGSSVILIKLSGLDLGGTLGQLNLLKPNFSCTNFSMKLPYSLAYYLNHLDYLNVSHNDLSGPIGHIFTDLQNLRMDMSHNSFSGDLPSSFANMTNLTCLHMQKHEFTGEEENTYSPASILCANLGVCLLAILAAVCMTYGWSDTVRHFRIEELRRATNQFAGENILGVGSLGYVFKANFSNGEVLAVKKINTKVLTDSEILKFKTEVRYVSKLKHQNIVTLVGSHIENGEHLLLYEYITNGSLEKAQHLTWIQRICIAVGTAQALMYMHSKCSPPLAHGNIKPSNILLDAEFRPQLSDCGLVPLRPFTEYEAELDSSRLGYNLPNRVVDKLKCDVYAFGVILLELFTGKKAYDVTRPPGQQSLVEWATSFLTDAEILKTILVPELGWQYSSFTLSLFGETISMCIKGEDIAVVLVHLKSAVLSFDFDLLFESDNLNEIEYVLNPDIHLGIPTTRLFSKLALPGQNEKHYLHLLRRYSLGTKCIVSKSKSDNFLRSVSCDLAFRHVSERLKDYHLVVDKEEVFDIFHYFWFKNRTARDGSVSCGFTHFFVGELRPNKGGVRGLHCPIQFHELDAAKKIHYKSYSIQGRLMKVFFNYEGGLYKTGGSSILLGASPLFLMAIFTLAQVTGSEDNHVFLLGKRVNLRITSKEGPLIGHMVWD